MSEEEDFVSNLKTYEEALKEEHATVENDTDEAAVKKARVRLFRILPNAVQELNRIVISGDKEDAVSLSAIKTVLEYTIGKPVAKSTKEDDVGNIVEALMRRNDPKEGDE